MKLLDKLNETNSTAIKKVGLKGISFKEWQTFLYAYSPYMVYRMKFDDDYISEHIGEPTEELFKLLDDVLDGTIIGKTAKTKVNEFANENGDLIKLIINKDLQCGVSATTFNKAHPGSIAQFKVQLAKEVPIVDLKYPLLVQLKYDGVRLIAINRDGKVKFYTRNGKVVALPNFKELIESIPAANYILDGEVTLRSGKMEDRTKISGMINSAMHGGSINEDNVVFNCFDFMTLSQWEATNCPDTYEVRFSLLKEIIEKASHDNLTLATTLEAHNPEAVSELYDKTIAGGFEGLVLKQADHKYTFKRSKDWVKVKEVKTADIKCVNIQDGTGKYQGMIGALICEGEVEGENIRVNVGSGLTDLQRALPESEFMFRTIEVKYNAIIKDSATGEWSLFLPRFVMVRLDK